MKIEYILNVTTLEELKKEYRRLAVLHHPDNGGDAENMKILNNEYDYLFERLKNTHKSHAGEYYEKESTGETPEEWKELIEKLIALKMVDVTIEIIGSFIWISGNTKPYKDALKALGFKWSQNKMAWYMAPEGYRRKSRKQYDLNDIRGMYGNSTVKTDSEKEKEGKSKKKRKKAVITA